MRILLKFALFCLLSGCTPEKVQHAQAPIEQDNVSANNEFVVVAPIYQIWVRSFYDSNNDGSGDIRGIIEKFDHIKSLNVKSILLSPVFSSPSYHGYDVTDFYSVNSTYGDMQALEALISLCHKNSIKVILDIPINHTSDQHPWFQNSINRTTPYEGYYRWVETLPQDHGFPWDEDSPATATWHTKGKRSGYYYGLFGFASPDLNFKNKSVVEEIKKVFAFWVGKSVDGFRIDAARHLVEEGPNPLQADTASNMAFIREINAHVKSLNPDTFIIGETYASLEESVAYFEGDDAFDALFNFEFSGAIRGLFEESMFNERLLNKFDRATQADVKKLYDFLWENQPPGKAFYVFINSHDLERFKSPDLTSFNIEKMIASLTLLSPFANVIYYGEEIGLQQVPGNEHELQRAIMPWDDTSELGFSSDGQFWLDEHKWFPWKKSSPDWSGEYSALFHHTSVLAQEYKGSILDTYRKMLLLKSTDEVLTDIHEYEVLKGEPKLWWVKYHNQSGTRFVVTNLSPIKKIKVQMPQNQNAKYVDLISNQIFEPNTEFWLEPGVTAVFKELTKGM